MNKPQKAHVRDLLKRQGLRYSGPREAILCFFREQDMHVSAEGLYKALKGRGENLSLSTVYLNLNVLAEAGLVREFSGIGGEALYDSNIEPHHHLLCKGCGAVLDLPVPEVEGGSPSKFLKKHAEAASGWQVEEPTLELKGICPSCKL